MIDCNKAELLSKEELRKRIAPYVPLEIKEKTIPSYLKRDVCSAIIQSPLIAPFIKKNPKGEKIKPSSQPKPTPSPQNTKASVMRDGF